MDCCAVELVLVVLVTLPVEPLLPVALDPESSRLNENLFGLRLKLATLSVTYCCNELKKLISSIIYIPFSLSHAETMIGPIAIVFGGASRSRRGWDLLRGPVLFARIDLEATGRREREKKQLELSSRFFSSTRHGRIDSPPIRGALLPSFLPSSSSVKQGVT